MTSNNQLQVYFNRESLESLLDSDYQDFLVNIYLDESGNITDTQGTAYKMDVTSASEFPTCPYPCRPPVLKAIEGCGDFQDRLQGNSSSE